MGYYRLTPQADEDLNRIWQRGLREYGEALADKYFSNSLSAFKGLQSSPISILPLMTFVPDTAAVFAVQTVYTTASLGTALKS